MSLGDNLYKLTGGLAPPAYRITILGGAGVFIEGVSKLIDIKTNQISIECSKTAVTFEGKNLKVLSYCARDLYISGEVIKVVKG